jgi:hypothetical protein
MTFVYADQRAVLSPLSSTAEPNGYDLCDRHARSLTAPKGWDLVVADGALDDDDDLLTMVDLVTAHQPADAETDPADNIVSLDEHRKLRLLQAV